MNYLRINLDSKRLLQLMRIDFLANFKRVLQGSAAIIIFALLCAFLLRNDTEAADSSHYIFVIIYLLLGGGLFTSVIFSDMHHPLEKFHYLLLPCSNLERFVSRYLLTGPLFILFALGVSQLTLIAGILLAPLVIDDVVKFYSIADMNPIEVVLFALLCFLIHALLFLAAIVFRGYSLPKAMIAGFLVFLLCTFTFFLSTKIIFWDYFVGIFTLNTTQSIPLGGLDIALSWLLPNIYVLIAYWLVFYLWILYVAYICLQEHEA